MTNPSTSPVEFTASARDTVRKFLQANEDTKYAVRIRVASPSPLDPRYEILMIEPDEKCAEDVVFDGYGFDVVMEPESAKLLDGARVDWIETLNGGGFKGGEP